jgi:hypothetical protein
MTLAFTPCRAVQFTALALLVAVFVPSSGLAQNTNNGVNSAIVAGVGNLIAAGARVSFIDAGRDNLT